MGARTALLAFADADLRPVLRNAAGSDPIATEALVRAVHPGFDVRPSAGITLAGAVDPPLDVTYAAVLPGASILCDRRLRFDLPSKLPDHLIRAAAGRQRIILHGMDSATDGLTFAVWEDGVLVRSLSVSPRDGIRENIGEAFNFEHSFWAGRRPVEASSYPLSFHPVELGEEILRALFGFIREGQIRPDDIDPEGVPMHGFQVTDPSGAEQAAREAAHEQLGRHRLVPGGTMQEAQ